MLKFFLLSLTVINTLALDISKLLDLFDGPEEITDARINTTVNSFRPSVKEIKYYNYYAALVSCEIPLNDTDCRYCPKIKNDIKEYVVLKNSTSQTVAIVALSEKRQEIVVAFRGTKNFENALYDIDFINISPDKDKRFKVHRGFYFATMSLYDQVVKTIAKYQSGNKKYKIVLAGHSLGGAMTRMTQFLLLRSKRFPGVELEVYTFGEPRSGNKYYVDYLNSQRVKTARTTNKADIVCHVPPTTVLGTSFITDPYIHVLLEYSIQNKKQKFADPSVYEDPTCANSYGPSYNVDDHFQYFDVDHHNCRLDD